MAIRWRLTLFNALTIVLILAVCASAVFFLLYRSLLSSLKDTTQKQALDAARTVQAGGIPNEDQAERFILSGVVVVVRDEQGQVLLRSSDPAGLTNQAAESTSLTTDNKESTSSARRGEEDSVWRQALASNTPIGGDAQLSSEAPDYVYAVPVNPPDSPARIVEAGKPYEPLWEFLKLFGVALAMGIVAVVLLAVGGAYLLARTALAPVNSIVGSAHEITEGDLSKRLPVLRPKDEIGRLATTINDLLARLEAAFTRREEALAHSEEALIRQQRFVSDAGHELKTPLTSIEGYAQMLKKWGLKDQKIAQEATEAIHKESGRMRRLVEDLLTLARGDESVPIKPDLHDLGGVAGEAVQAAQGTAHGKGIMVDYTPLDKPVEATFDWGRIRQVATILLDNALKYTPEGGTVAVAVYGKDGWARLEVSDTGIGIPEEQLPLIFERFHRVDPARTEGGTGLGLTIARQIIETHYGKIKVTSMASEGSTFILELPKNVDLA